MVLSHRFRLGIPCPILDRSRLVDCLGTGTPNPAFESRRYAKTENMDLATPILVLALLTVESSYTQNIERPASKTPDTLQFWIAPDGTWRIKTYAIDEDVHIHRLGNISGDRSKFA